MYQLVEDYQSVVTILSIRARFDTAYVTGSSIDQDTMEILKYYAKGTWISELGVQVSVDTYVRE